MEGGHAILQAKLERDLDDLHRTLVRLREFAQAHDVSPVEVERIVLSVDEVLTNVIRYGTRKSALAELRVQAAVADDVFRVVIEDRGTPFDPFRNAPVPDTSLPLEERSIGGLGVFLVRSLMTSADYERIEDRNRITLTRSLADGDQEEEAQ